MQIKLPVRSLVVLNSDALEAVRIVGAQDLVVGVYNRIPEAPLFWGDLAKRTIVGDWREPNCEIIAALHPDLVLAYGNTPGPELDRQMQALGITLLRLDFFRLKTLPKEIQDLGKLLGKNEEADRFVRWHQANLAELQRLVAQGGVRPRVYMEGYSSMKAAGPGSSGYAMCLAAGGDPISASLAIPHPMISTEWLLRENPQVIVKVSNLMDSYDSENDSGLAAIYQSMVKRQGWDNLNAVRNKRVHVMAHDIWVGPGMLLGLTHMAKWFYPQACKSLRPQALHREFLERFQSVGMHGHFVYPPME
ncbi:MAG: ABC transporter substrate-binding protein [Desulfarculaceae bacterium]